VTTVVCEWIVQDRPEDMPETRREVVRVDCLPEFVEDFASNTNVSTRSFRVLLAFEWEDE
jgi:hypothetical protein